MVSKALQLLWKGTCNIVVREGHKNPTNKRTEFNEMILYENEPCKLSFESLKTNNENNNAAEILQATKLFISNQVQVPPGSKIVVTQNDVTESYEQSGKPAIYTNHQEVMLKLFKEWA